MLELLFIYALNTGITGSPKNHVEPVTYIEAEAGMKIDALYLMGGYYIEPEFYEQDVNAQHFNVKLFVEADGVESGIILDYDCETGQNMVTMYFRYESRKE